MLELPDPDGAPLRRRDTPAGIAFFERRPAHRSRSPPATTVSGIVETTAYPLSGRGEMHGVVTVFWEPAPTEPADAGSSLGMSRLAGRAGRRTVRYGGNTSCIEVRLESGHALVLDAGTGMRALGGGHGGAVDEVHILLTHLHLDHLQGLGFFRPLFRPDVDVHLWGPPSPVQSLADRIAIYLSPPLFPVRLADIPASSRSTTPRRNRSTSGRRRSRRER